MTSLNVKSVFVQSQAVQLKTDVNEDLYDEVLQTLEILKRLEKPDPPKVTGECLLTLFLLFQHRGAIQFNHFFL